MTHYVLLNLGASYSLVRPGIWQRAWGYAVVTNAGEMDAGTNEFSNCLVLCL